MDKQQQGQRQDQRKNPHYIWPTYQSCCARHWFTSDFEFVLNTAFSFGTQIFLKRCPVSCRRTSRWFLPGGSIRLLGYCWQRMKPALLRRGEFTTKACSGCNGQSNNDNGNRSALSPPVLHSRICLCFSRTVLSFHSIFFKATSLVLVLF